MYVLYCSLGIRQSAASIDKVTNRFQQVGEFTNTESCVMRTHCTDQVELVVKNPPAKTQETKVQALGQEDFLE